MRQLTFIGTGYVGLVSGTCMAELGHKVTCVDVDAEKIALLKKGDIPIYEPDLKEMVARNVAEERLSFTTNLAECVPKSDAVFIAVGTPQSQSGQANLEYVFKAAEDIAPLLEGYTVVVTKSTVPVGANKQVKQVVLNTNPHANFDVATQQDFSSSIGDVNTKLTVAGNVTLKGISTSEDESSAFGFKNIISVLLLTYFISFG